MFDKLFTKVICIESFIEVSMHISEMLNHFPEETKDDAIDAVIEIFKTYKGNYNG